MVVANEERNLVVLKIGTLKAHSTEQENLTQKRNTKLGSTKTNKRKNSPKTDNTAKEHKLRIKN